MGQIACIRIRMAFSHGAGYRIHRMSVASLIYVDKTVNDNCYVACFHDFYRIRIPKSIQPPLLTPRPQVFEVFFRPLFLHSLAFG